MGVYLETVLTTLPPGEVPERAEEAGYAMIVADGMGGHAGGELASRMAISGLVKLVLAMPDWIFRLDETVAADAAQRSKRRFRDLHALLIEHGRQDLDFRGMGTTLTAARTMGRDLQIVHVGDSRAYLLRETSLHRLSSTVIEEPCRRSAAIVIAPMQASSCRRAPPRHHWIAVGCRAAVG